MLQDVANPRVDASAAAPEVSAQTARLFDRVRGVITPAEWALHAPVIDRINALKRQKNAVILAHNYQTPEIYAGVADIVGDSLQLARDAVTVDADIIVMAGVHFMAETAKLVNPDKRVLMPDMRAGCSLADSITPADVRLLRETFPGVPVATYVNTSAAVKAESDICITSGNAVKVIESLPGDEVLCIPDEYLAQWVATQTAKKVYTWKGHCEVHERFSAGDIAQFRKAYPDVVVIAHPECPPDVLEAADFVGSTARMSAFVREEKPKRVVMITECSMSDNVAMDNPQTQFVRPCNLCPHMKRITLDNILTCLESETTEIVIDPAVADRARLAVDRMLEASI